MKKRKPVGLIAPTQLPLTAPSVAALGTFGSYGGYGSVPRYSPYGPISGELSLTTRLKACVGPGLAHIFSLCAQEDNITLNPSMESDTTMATLGRKWPVLLTPMATVSMVIVALAHPTALFRMTPLPTRHHCLQEQQQEDNTASSFTTSQATQTKITCTVCLVPMEHCTTLGLSGTSPLVFARY